MGARIRLLGTDGIYDLMLLEELRADRLLGVGIFIKATAGVILRPTGIREGKNGAYFTLGKLLKTCEWGKLGEGFVGWANV